MRRIDLTGQKFGKLSVLGYDRTGESPRYVAYWKCKCECGKETVVTSGHLRSGHTQSCGCFQVENTRENNVGNTWGRKFEDPKMASAKRVWEMSYTDGCSFITFLKVSQEICSYCGIEPSNTYNAYLTKDGKSKNSRVNVDWAEQAYFTYNGLDRIDPDKDHSEDNIVPSCYPCNIAKHDMTLGQFREWIVRVARHLIKNEIISIDDII